MSEWMTVKECAENVGVSVMTVYRLIHDGTLPASIVGRRAFRIRTADWQDYLKEARI